MNNCSNSWFNTTSLGTHNFYAEICLFWTLLLHAGPTCAICIPLPIRRLARSCCILPHVDIVWNTLVQWRRLFLCLFIWTLLLHAGPTCAICIPLPVRRLARSCCILPHVDIVWSTLVQWRRLFLCLFILNLAVARRANLCHMHSPANQATG